MGWNFPVPMCLKVGTQGLMLFVKRKGIHEAAEEVISSNNARVRAENSLRETTF